MLYISFKSKENTIESIGTYFNYNYQDEWFDDVLVKEMVQDVDKTTVISQQCAVSPVLGTIPVTKLSGGVKALILLLKAPELNIWATACGDNCAKWIVKISELQDIHIVLEHIMQFPGDFEAVCEDTGEEIHCLDDYRRCVLKCL